MNKKAISMRLVFRIIVTVLVCLLGIWAVRQIWDHYELAPWTRDGRIRANVVVIAPDVSGLVTHVAVNDNQHVNVGDLLFIVDRSRYQLSVDRADVTLASRKTAMEQAQREYLRNRNLGNLVPTEELERSRVKYEQAVNDFNEVKVIRDQSRLDLQRAEVKSPVSGRVTNLDLRTGGYATKGKDALAVVDERSLYAEGYFEETKLPRIHVGDSAQVIPMSGGLVITGTVESIAAGIAERDRTVGTNLLSDINPTFNWVRLAQRIPVRIKLDLSKNPTLVAGQTVTVEVEDHAERSHRSKEGKPQ
ncbi:HlyD family secretion protein [Serratia bockelmannii]|uniref:HlyD family secretion protein n=1 Tax=Serratia bockelmannii TaxID=2703793 RepID=UPI00313A8E9D